MAQNPPSNLKTPHKYQVWKLAPEDEPRRLEATAPSSRAAVKTSTLADLDTMLLLYRAGRSMDLSAASKCTLPGGQSADCTTQKVSSESIQLVYNPPSPDAPEAPRPSLRVGAPVSLNVEDVGSLRGVLTSQNEQGFQISVNQESRNLVGTRLAHIAVKRGIGIEATGAIKTGAPRIQLVRSACEFTDYSATLRKGVIVNLSRYDALIRASAAIIPPLGSRIVLRGREWHGADVISAFEIGFVVQFCIPFPEDKFSKDLLFLDTER